MGFIADTSYLVGIWRRQKWALDFVSEYGSEALYIPWVVQGEFWHGAKRAKHPEDTVREFLTKGILVSPFPEIIDHYAEICVQMQEQNLYKQVGQNDIWIGACASACSMPLVTRNKRHFQSMPGVELHLC